jgi:hypothetical protein
MKSNIKKLATALVSIGLCSTSFAMQNPVVAKAITHDYNLYCDGHAKRLTFAGYHDIYLSNPTNHQINYTVVYSLCLETKKPLCQQTVQSKVLSPGQTYQEHFDSQVTNSFDGMPISYYLKATTTIMGEYSDTQMSLYTVMIKN